MKRAYKRLPCKKCPVFVMCRTHSPIVCKLLYKYLFDEHVVPADSTFYRRMKQIKIMFNKHSTQEYHYFVNSKNELGVEWVRRRRS